MQPLAQASRPEQGTTLPTSAGVAVLARLFALLAIAVPVAWSRDARGALGVVALAIVFGAAMAARPSPRRLDAVVLEALAVGALVGASAHDNASAMLAALVVPPFIAGLRHDVFGVLVVASSQLVTLLGSALLFGQDLTEPISLDIFTWTMTGLGIGLVVSYAAGLPVGGRSDTAALAPYRHARGLLAELLDLSGGLSSGLDPETLATTLLRDVRDALPTGDMAILVPRGEGLTPLRSEFGVTPGWIESVEPLAARAALATRPIIESGGFAIPLHDGGRLLGLIVGSLPRLDIGTTLQVLRDTDESLTRRLTATAVRLDTALLFAAFRDNATADERRRLAREIHDGVAQDIASMGYLVDALIALAESDEQRARLQGLRERITSVVGEVRRSVLTLRSEVGESESLGAAISMLARHLSNTSGIAIQVTVDERTTRLRPEVEAELMRICQEAMSNAVRHSGATRIDVSCRVDPPLAEIVVSDDGHGITPGRADSFGLTIMRERAALAGATLTLDSSHEGTTVSVQVSPSESHEVDPG